MLLNAGSTHNNVASLTVIVDERPDLMCVSESWLDEREEFPLLNSVQ